MASMGRTRPQERLVWTKHTWHLVWRNQEDVEVSRPVDCEEGPVLTGQHWSTLI